MHSYLFIQMLFLGVIEYDIFNQNVSGTKHTPNIAQTIFKNVSGQLWNS